MLIKLEVRVIRLPLERTGLADLKRFGYDLFQESPSTFSPVTDVPVPANYVVGSGDQLSVQLFGNQSRNLQLRVNPRRSVNFPGLGPIAVNGLTFTEAKSRIERLSRPR